MKLGKKHQGSGLLVLAYIKAGLRRARPDERWTVTILCRAREKVGSSNPGYKIVVCEPVRAAGFQEFSLGHILWDSFGQDGWIDHRIDKDYAGMKFDHEWVYSFNTYQQESPVALRFTDEKMMPNRKPDHVTREGSGIWVDGPEEA